MYNIETYKTSSGREPLRDFLLKLANGGNALEIAQIKDAKKELAEKGLALKTEKPKLISPLKKGLYELRPGSNRVFFFFFDGNTIVLLHGFKKKSQKTPKIEIDNALDEMQDYKRRHQHE